MEESYGGASGEYPEYGAIFMSNSSTRKECLRRELFGLPMWQAGFVKQVKAGMILFLFEFESRELHGVFRACSDGAMNIEPDAYRSSGKQFPAQVKFTQIWRCRPLRESEFRHAIEENYFTAKKFKFGLSEAQVDRLLKLFSLKREDRPQPRKIAVRKSTRTIERNLRNADGDHGIKIRCPEEIDGDADRKYPFGVASAARDRGGRRLTENPGVRNESDTGLEYDLTIGNEYPGDSSGVCRRLVDPKCHGSNDRVGYDVNMNNSFCTDALTNNSPVNDRRFPKNLRHTASGRMENEYQQKDGTTQAMSNFEEDPMVQAQSSVPRDLPNGTSTEYYDPCEPGILGDATMQSARHDPGDPNVGLIGSPSFAANSTYGLEEEIIPVGGYVSDALPSETVQPFPDEHNGTSMNDSSMGLDYYIPMPIEYHEYQANTGMFGVARAESESRNGHFHHSQFPDLLTSPEERPPYSNPSIFPSFPYHLISRNLSPKGGLNNEFLTHQHEEEFGGHVSYTSDMVIRDSSIYPSFTYTSTLGDGADLYPENRTNNEVQAYQRHEEFGGDDLNSNNRVTQVKDHFSPAEFERKRTRESVFKRLSGPSKELDAEKDKSPDTESVDEVMAFLNGCHKSWMEQERANMSNSEGFGIPKKKKEKIRTAEELDNDLMLPFTETTPDDLLDCEESVEHSVQKQPFIDFKRRSEARKSLRNPTQGCQDNPKNSASQNKKRKLLRPKLIDDDSEKDQGNKDEPGNSVLASQSATEVLVRDFSGRYEDDLEKDRTNNNDPSVKFFASQLSTGVHDFLGLKEDGSEKNRGKNDDPTVTFLASQSATEIPVHDFLGLKKDGSEKNRGKNDDPTVTFLASQSATEIPVHDFLGLKKDGSEKDKGNTDDPIEYSSYSHSANESLVHSENDRGNNDQFLASQVTTKVPIHDFLGLKVDGSEKDRGNIECPIEKVLNSQSATDVPFHDFLGCEDR